MTVTALIQALTAKGFDVSLNEAPDGTACPYVVLTDIRHPNFGADDIVYAETTELTIRLVEANIHDWELIKTLKDTLTELELFYEENDVSDESEHICETHFEISFYGGIA